MYSKTTKQLTQQFRPTKESNKEPRGAYFLPRCNAGTPNTEGKHCLAESQVKHLVQAGHRPRLELLFSSLLLSSLLFSSLLFTSLLCSSLLFSSLLFSSL